MTRPRPLPTAFKPFSPFKPFASSSAAFRPLPLTSSDPLALPSLAESLPLPFPLPLPLALRPRPWVGAERAAQSAATTCRIQRACPTKASVSPTRSPSRVGGRGGRLGVGTHPMTCVAAAAGCRSTCLCLCLCPFDHDLGLCLGL